MPKISKGIVGYLLKFKNNKDPKFESKLSIYNCHLPFEEDVNINKEFISTLRKKILNNSNYTFTDSIIFGDLNSRSLVTNKCYVKKSETCPLTKKKGETQTEGYCDFAEIYNNLQENNSFEHIPEVPSTTPKWDQNKNNLEYCGEGLGEEVASVNDQQDEKKKVVELISLLKNRDFLCNPPNHSHGQNGFFDEMNESDIKFLPTYKRLSDTGFLTTIDKDKVRLPGYADRIIFNNVSNSFEPEEETYTSFFITGNDHLPVYQEFTLKTPSYTAAEPSSVLSNSEANDETNEANYEANDETNEANDEENEADSVETNNSPKGGGKRKKTKQRRRRKRNTKLRKKKRRTINNKKSRKRNYKRKSHRS